MSGARFRRAVYSAPIMNTDGLYAMSCSICRPASIATLIA